MLYYRSLLFAWYIKIMEAVLALRADNKLKVEVTFTLTIYSCVFQGIRQAPFFVWLAAFYICSFRTHMGDYNFYQRQTVLSFFLFLCIPYIELNSYLYIKILFERH